MIRSRYILSLAFLAGVSSWAAGGREVGNGGDAVVQEFVSIARSILAHWERLEFPGGVEVRREQFETAVRETRVDSKDRTFLGDREVDAINRPDLKTITLSRTRWGTNGTNSSKKLALVLHEYLGILGLDDSGYLISSHVLQKLEPLLHAPPKQKINFQCRIEMWLPETPGARTGRSWTLAQMDTYEHRWQHNALRHPFDSNHPVNSYEISFRKEEDFISQGARAKLSFSINRRANVNRSDEIVSDTEVRFRRSGRVITRVLDDPELDLICYRTLDHL